MDTEKVEKAISDLAKQAEEISAVIFEANPRQSLVFRKIAAHCRQVANCLRVYGALPDPRKGSPLVEAAKAAQQIHTQISRVTQLFPKRG